MAWVYRIVRLKTGQCYIGHTSKSPTKRWNEHLVLLRKNSHHSRYLQNAWNKYGESNFKFDVIESCDEAEKLVREQYWIDGLDSCFNLAKVAGSRKGVKFTEVQRELLSRLRTGKKLSAETKQKIGLANKAVAHFPRTAEDKKKIGAASKEWWQKNKQTPAQREAMLRNLVLARQKNRVNKPGMSWRVFRKQEAASQP